MVYGSLTAVTLTAFLNAQGIIFVIGLLLKYAGRITDPFKLSGSTALI